MSKKYPDCADCSLSSYGKDCNNNAIIKLAKLRIGNLTQKELAEKTGINIRTIQKYEGGEIPIEKMSLGNARNIAKALNCSIDDLL